MRTATQNTARMAKAVTQSMPVRSIIVKSHPCQVFERDRGRSNVLRTTVALPDGCEITQNVTLRLSLVYWDSDIPVVYTGPGPMIEMQLSEADTATAYLGPNKRESTIAFRVNCLSGKSLFKLVVEPQAPDVLTKDGMLLGKATTTAFRVISKAVRRQRVCDHDDTDLSDNGSTSKRAHSVSSDDACECSSSKRSRPTMESMSRQLEDVAATVLVLVKQQETLAVQQAALARLVSDNVTSGGSKEHC